MRTIKLVIAAALAVSLMVIVAANMTPVDLRLLPDAFGIEVLRLTAVPLSMVIVIAALTGLLVGYLLEYAREAKHRANLARKRRELGELRDQNTRLIAMLEKHGEDLSLLPR